jgi:alpha-D-ribose 1-methylphosphonate 5-triphosphate diphosphatase
MPAANQQLFTNANIVLADEVVHGCVQVTDGHIADISTGVSSSDAADLDCQGDYLIPGLIELHTDHLETHYSPRPGVRWEVLPSIQAHDAQIAAAGITTVFDCLRCGRERPWEYAAGEMNKLAEAMRLAADQNRLRVEHRLHLRCEVSASDVMDDFHLFDSAPDVGLVSLMDHAPGQRQFPSLESYADYHQKKLKMSDKEFSDYVDVRVNGSRKYSDKHRQLLAKLCAERGIPLASHDDATLTHVKESILHGVSIAEFPTTLEAARESHQAGLGVLMGAPNVVRGQSHTGNVAARTLIENNCLDVLSSDYIPSSLLQAVFLLSIEWDLISLPAAIALVTKNPADALKLKDRGEIAVGRKADLVRVAHKPSQDATPIVRSVWRDGLRVM